MPNVCQQARQQLRHRGIRSRARWKVKKPSRCGACGVKWVNHLGVQGTCEALQSMRKDRDAIQRDRDSWKRSALHWEKKARKK